MMHVTLDDRPGPEAAVPVPDDGVSTKTGRESPSVFLMSLTYYIEII